MQPNLRYEQKMVFDAQRLPEVRSWVLSHSKGYREAYPSRYVNNIYFDTLDWDMLLSHLDGVARREKVRYRWYGKTWTPGKGQIEVKVKQAQLGFKKQQRISLPLSLENKSWRTLLRVLKENSSGEFSELFDLFTPVLINRYQREYYVSGDGNVRITLDYGMEAFEQVHSFSPNTKFKQLLQNNVVIEVKADQIYHQSVADVIAEFPIYTQQHSKYLNGLELLWG